jgi:hypothetical protein
MRFSVHLCHRKFLNKHLRFPIHDLHVFVHPPLVSKEYATCFCHVRTSPVSLLYSFTTFPCRLIVRIPHPWGRLIYVGCVPWTISPLLFLIFEMSQFLPFFDGNDYMISDCGDPCGRSTEYLVLPSIVIPSCWLGCPIWPPFFTTLHFYSNIFFYIERVPPWTLTFIRVRYMNEYLGELFHCLWGIRGWCHPRGHPGILWGLPVVDRAYTFTFSSHFVGCLGVPPEMVEFTETCPHRFGSGVVRVISYFVCPLEFENSEEVRFWRLS